MEDELLSIGKKIKFYRNMRGLTQNQVAEAIGIDNKYYESVENSRRFLKLSKLIMVCKFFKITLNDLIDLSEYEDKSEIKERCKNDIAKELDKMDAEQVGKLVIALRALNE